MPMCSICGESVLSGRVMHEECIRALVERVAAVFCTENCIFHMWQTYVRNANELEEICDGCPMRHLADYMTGAARFDMDKPLEVRTDAEEEAETCD